jgi:hypothetical protein
VQERRIGQSYVRFEPPDLLVEVITDELTDDELREFMMLGAEWLRGKRDVFIIADISGLSTLSPANRKVVREMDWGADITGIAMIGASFHMRVVAQLIVKAIQLLQRRSYELHFFDAEADAHAWVAELRRKNASRADRRSG